MSGGDREVARLKTASSRDLSELFSLLWNRSSEKLHMNIPETIIIDDEGRIACWLFTSKDGYVLKRSLNRTNATDIKETFIQEALRDPTNVAKFICVARGGPEPLLLKGTDFLLICDQISLSEEQIQPARGVDLPQALQLYVRPLSDLRYVFTYNSSQKGEATWNCIAQKYASRYSSDLQDLNATSIGESSASDGLVNEFKKQTLSLLHYLTKVHGINPVHLVLEFIQNNMGVALLTAIISAEWTSQPFPVVLSKQLTNSRSGYTAVPALDLRTVAPYSRPSSGSAYSARKSSRPTSRSDIAHTPHPPMSSSRPGTAARPNTSRSTHADSARQSSNIPAGGLALELTREVDLCKAQLASAMEDLTRCKELLEHENERAAQAEADLDSVRRRLQSSLEEKSELASTLSQVWVEAKQQAQDLKQAQKLISEQESRLASVATEKDSLARHLSDVIVDLKARLEDQATKLATYESGGQDLEARLVELQTQLNDLRDQRDAEQRRVTEMQALLAAREREIRLRLDRGDRIRTEPSRTAAGSGYNTLGGGLGSSGGGLSGIGGGYNGTAGPQAAVKGKTSSTFGKVLAQTKRSQVASDDVDDAVGGAHPLRQAFATRQVPPAGSGSGSGVESGDADADGVGALGGKRSDSQIIQAAAAVRRSGQLGSGSGSSSGAWADDDGDGGSSATELAAKRAAMDESPTAQD